MTKRMVRTLGLVLLTTPALVVGCGGSSDNSGGTGGGGHVNWDGGGGAGGTVDGGNGPEVQLPPVDTAAPVDIAINPDVPAYLDTALDVNTPDAPIVDTRPPAFDGAVDLQAVDTGVDGGVIATCTEKTKFSGGTVNIDRTLTKACSPYTIKTDIDVYSNSTLTIEPGVTLRFEPNVNVAIGYNSAGKISAVGTATDPIVFTSSAPTPGPGDWAGVQLWTNTMNGTVLQYVKFDYCGSADDACLLGSGVKPNRVTVDHVSFAHVGTRSSAIWQKDKDSSFTIANCTFSDIPAQQYAIAVWAPSFAGIDSTNVFNGGAMVELLGGTIAATTTWKNVGTTIAVTTNDLAIEGTSTPVLTIAEGSVLKFATGAGIGIGYGAPGSLSLAGTATAPITLTSMAGTPAAADWAGIELWNKGTAKIKYATIAFAGSSRGAITLNGNTTSVDIQSSTVSDSGSYGIYVPCSSTATIVNTGNTFTRCADGDVGPTCP